MMKRLTVGILAHVDAGKTTLSESILYLSGAIRKPGRVDHGDTFFDNFDLERARGITIFSKQARFTVNGVEMTLVDTPGHVDFSAEMERTLQILDVAILVISGPDGVQAHTETLTKLLARYRIPTILFVNKMDMPGVNRDGIMEQLKNRIDSNCIDMERAAQKGELDEELAMCDDEILERYMESGEISEEETVELFNTRKFFPVYFGAALKDKNVPTLLEAVARLGQSDIPDDADEKEFAARVYKIGRDAQGARLTYMKILAGKLQAKMTIGDEKAEQIRLVNGTKFESVKEALPGMLAAVTGLEESFAGQGLGTEESSVLPMLEPVLTYEMLLPPDCDVHSFLRKLKLLEEEDPSLHIVWDNVLQEIYVQLMGEVQTEILKKLILDRFGVAVNFGDGRIVYKETIAAPVEGVGHFEPLRHYAEVHLLIEPGERGSGLVFAADCSEDVLAKNWQRLVLTHLAERQHRGVLTGSQLTDVRITLTGGRAHQKHTEGGDFRQATYRAVRQGLMKAQNVLLEPYYDYKLELPEDAPGSGVSQSVGRAMGDLQRMCATVEGPFAGGGYATLTGRAPVSFMRNYLREVAAYTKGRGRLTLQPAGYDICHDTEAVLEHCGYDPERDLRNPADSVFCAHGSGFVVPWYEVELYMHENGLDLEEYDVEAAAAEAEAQAEANARAEKEARGASYQNTMTSAAELDEIFRREFGQTKSERYREEQKTQRGRSIGQPAKEREYIYKPKAPMKEYLLVDGYNIIFGWDDLRAMSEITLDNARQKLMDILSNYQAIKKSTVILVFDAYKVKGNPGEIFKYHNIHVVFTKEAETADMYIEKTTHELGRKNRVVVATSDGTEQVIIMGQGCIRMSARELKAEIEKANHELRSDFIEKPTVSKNYMDLSGVNIEDGDEE